ncbi:MAG TPA: beta-glucosidase [Firmicutes bacterium]|nr:beta-glucosidase [Bacillota bacterium]
MKFPDDFIWGVATASYQIEGAANEDGRGASIWDQFSHTPGKTLHGHTGDVACNHYHLYKEDVALMKQLGVDSYRFSIAWPRIFPQGAGKANPRGIDFYKRLLEELLKQGIKPAATLYHWDLPQALEEKDGWLNRDTAYRFADYAEKVFAELGDLVHSWITLNEPWCSAFLGYGNGQHAPGIKSRTKPFIATHNLLLAHGLAVEAYRRFNLRADIGITLNLSAHYPAGDEAADLKALKKADGFQNRLYLDPVFKGMYPQDLDDFLKVIEPHLLPGDLELISQDIDFLGINYYTRAIIGADKEGGIKHHRGEGPRTAMDWEIYPEGLYDLLLRLHRDYGPLPFYITENGAAFEDTVENGTINDIERLEYIKGHFAHAARAIAAGVPLKGFYVWSFLDNFEWAFGYERRFGLIYVDFATQERIMKESARWYQQFLSEQSQSQ